MARRQAAPPSQPVWNDFRPSNRFALFIIAGEHDLCLPSIGEAERLSSIFTNSHVFVVEGAGHASTCGSRADLAALLRKRFPELTGRTAMKAAAASGKGPYLGMEPRYDGRDDVGLSPLKYWNKDNYRAVATKRNKIAQLTNIRVLRYTFQALCFKDLFDTSTSIFRPSQ
jgi:hypothetical protein